MKIQCEALGCYNKATHYWKYVGPNSGRISYYAWCDFDSRGLLNPFDIHGNALAGRPAWTELSKEEFIVAKVMEQ